MVLRIVSGSSSGSSVLWSQCVVLHVTFLTKHSGVWDWVAQRNIDIGIDVNEQGSSDIELVWLAFWAWAFGLDSAPCPVTLLSH